MLFHKRFERGVTEINDRRLEDSIIQEALKRYNRRSLVFKVRKDATYVFYFSSKDGVRYELNPKKEPRSMYVEMDIDKAKKLVYRHTLGVMDALSTVHRNIKMGDINFVRKIFGA
jgi:Mor family transcriptional regulator